MKFFYPKFLPAILFLFFAFNAKAVNDSTLTIRQVFDWKVGDSLIYNTTEGCAYFVGGHTEYISTTYLTHFVSILSRQDYSDSLVYGINVNGVIHSIVIRDIDSSAEKFDGEVLFGILGCHSSPWNCSNSNCDTTNFVSSVFGNRFGVEVNSLLVDNYLRFSVIKDLGLLSRGEGGQSYCGLYPGGRDVSLVYYKSDSTTWIDSVLYFYTNISEQTPAPTFHLYPNPATDELTITTESKAPVDVYIVDVYIYDMLGNCVLSHKNFSHNLVDIDVSLIPPGYYLLKLTDQHGLSSSKGFIIAR